MLTDKMIKGLRVPSAGQYDKWDGDGCFGIRVGKQTKTFFVGLRHGGKYRRITIGRYPAIDLKEARRRAREIIADPSGALKAKREARTFGAVAEAFMTDYAHSHRTRDEMQRKINVDLAIWHDRQITDITRGDIKELLRTKARVGGIAANRLLALISKIFTWAVDEEIIDASPAMRLPRPAKEKDRERVLSADEIGRLWPALETLGYPCGPLYQMMLCTAQRRGEVASMKWSQIGPDGWRLPGASAKTNVGHLVPLSTLARETLNSVPHIGEYVFRSGRTDAPYQGWSKSKARLDRLVTLDAPWQVEDTRRTAATHMRSLGVDRVVVDKILNHADGGIIRVYDRWSADPEKTAALERWATRLREIISGKARGHGGPDA